MGISFPKKVDHSRTLLIPKMISLLLFLIPLSSSRLLDELKSPSFLDRDVLDEMLGAEDDIVIDSNDGYPSTSTGVTWIDALENEIIEASAGRTCFIEENPMKLCMFPFEYKGVTYKTCTTVDNNNTNWCKTLWGGPVGWHDGEEWGTCGRGCPGETEDPTACSTEEGVLCKFPFEYNGVTYNTCTSVDNYNIGWCETESGWGNCDPLTACP